MERRVFIAIGLSFLVLYMYQAYFAPPPPQVKPATSTTASSTPPSPPTAPASAASSPAVAPATPASSAPEPQAVVGESSARDIVVDTAKVQAVFTNAGGRLLHWRLKEYFDNSGQPVDLVPSGLPREEQLPFSLRVDQADLTTRLNTALYRVSGDTNGHVDATRSAAAVAFEFQDAAGTSPR